MHIVSVAMSKYWLLRHMQPTKENWKAHECEAWLNAFFVTETEALNVLGCDARIVCSNYLPQQHTAVLSKAVFSSTTSKGLFKRPQV